jgi:beta-lactam-binding protein with PASTA domain
LTFPMKAFFRLVLLALVLLVVALVSALTAMRLAVHGQELVVPDLVGKLPAEARRVAEQAGFQMEVERRYYSPTVPEDRILSQVPDSGTRVRRGWQIRVAQSLGPQRVEIPNLLGQSERAANINIRRRRLEVGTIARFWTPGVPADQVASQSPGPGASGISAPKISLLISDSAPAESFVMPNFVGMPLASVKNTLLDAGLLLGSVTVMAQPGTQAATGIPAPASVIVAQNPAAGDKIFVGTRVDLQVQ